LAGPTDDYDRWRAGIAGLDRADWERELGRNWGPYAESNRVDLALHVFDEVVHHAAEVGVGRIRKKQRSQQL
jgi:hypothetical protein